MSYDEKDTCISTNLSCLCISTNLSCLLTSSPTYIHTSYKLKAASRPRPISSPTLSLPSYVYIHTHTCVYIYSELVQFTSPSPPISPTSVSPRSSSPPAPPAQGVCGILFFLLPPKPRSAS